MYRIVRQWLHAALQVPPYKALLFELFKVLLGFIRPLRALEGPRASYRAQGLTIPYKSLHGPMMPYKIVWGLFEASECRVKAYAAFVTLSLRGLCHAAGGLRRPFKGLDGFTKGH